MMLKCPHCGGTVTVKGLGRKPFNIPVNNVYDAIRRYHSIPVAAEILGCSRAYIYKILKQHGMTSMDVINKENKKAENTE